MPLSKIQTNSLATGAITSAVMPSGSVLQVQYLQYTGTTTTACANGANQTLDHLTLNITPTATNSIIKLDASVNGEWGNSGALYNSVWFFYRGATKLAHAAAGSRLCGVAMTTATGYYGTNNDSTPETIYWSYLDTPSTTSQISYTVATAQSSGGSSTWHTNMTVADTSNAYYERGISFISATEIAG